MENVGAPTFQVKPEGLAEEEGTPPCFCVSVGWNGIASEFRGCVGRKGVEKEIAGKGLRKRVDGIVRDRHGL